MTYREAPATSRAAQVAQIHLNGINESRRRCGLDPLDVATLEHEFADVNQSPPARTKLTRRDAGNLAAPSSAQEITSMWDGIVAKLNASLPASRGPDEGRRAADDGRRPQEAAVDWGSITTKLNAENGLRPRSAR